MHGRGLAREAGTAVDGTVFAGVRGQARSHRGRARFEKLSKTVACARSGLVQRDCAKGGRALALPHRLPGALSSPMLLQHLGVRATAKHRRSGLR